MTTPMRVWDEIAGSIALGQCIRRIRRELDLSQEEISRVTGLSRNHIGKLERGEVVSPGVLAVCSVAGALQLSAGELALAFAFLEKPKRPPPQATRAATLGGAVRSCRGILGLSQRALARQAGLTGTALGELERDKIRDPRLGTVVRLARALGEGDECHTVRILMTFMNVLE